MYKNKEVYKKSIKFLLNKKADKLKHSGKTFLEHLVNVADILEQWGCNFDTVMAGMFHNIYGNKYYNPNLKVTRKDIQKLIGKKAEKLVWLFETTDRDNILQLKNLDLLLIKLANDFEQSNIRKASWGNINYEIKNIKEFNLNKINYVLYKLDNYTK